MWAPWSKEAVSKAQRVRVDAFSKIRAMFLPVRRGCSVPVYLARLRSRERSSKNRLLQEMAMEVAADDDQPFPAPHPKKKDWWAKKHNGKA